MAIRRQVPGLNRGAGMAAGPGFLLGRTGVGRGPIQPLNQHDLAQLGLQSLKSPKGAGQAIATSTSASTASAGISALSATLSTIVTPSLSTLLSGVSAASASNSTQSTSLSQISSSLSGAISSTASLSTVLGNVSSSISTGVSTAESYALSGTTSLSTVVSTKLSSNLSTTVSLSTALGDVSSSISTALSSATSAVASLSTAIPVTARTTFMPTITFATPGDLSVAYTIQTGAYVKVGPLVLFWISLAFTPTYTTASSNFEISLPPPTVTDNEWASADIRNLSALTWPAGTTEVIAVLTTTTILIQGVGSAAAATNFTTTQFPSGVAATIRIAGYYF